MCPRSSSAPFQGHMRPNVGFNHRPHCRKRGTENLRLIPGVKSVGLVDWSPLSGGTKGSMVFTEQTTDFRPANAAAVAMRLTISPEYFHAAGTALLSRRAF